MGVTIYHNPRCGKSRATLALLDERDVEPTVVEYLTTPPDAKRLKQLLKLLGMSPRELMRKGEAVYKEKGLADPKLDDAALIAAMVADPILIERPIVVVKDAKGERAALGRPPENVLEIL
jgi:arsenate reductase